MKGGSILKYKDIKTLYQIVDINEEYIVTMYDNILTRVYIYEITPVVLFDINEERKNNILNKYKEILKQINFDFEVLMINQKFDIDKYINKLKNNSLVNEKNKSIYFEYVKELKEKILNENIYETIYYIVVSFANINNLNVESVDKIIKKFADIGCNVTRISGKDNLVKILNNTINRREM